MDLDSDNETVEKQPLHPMYTTPDEDGISDLKCLKWSVSQFFLTIVTLSHIDRKFGVWNPLKLNCRTFNRPIFANFQHV